MGGRWERGGVGDEKVLDGEGGGTRGEAVDEGEGGGGWDWGCGVARGSISGCGRYAWDGTARPEMSAANSENFSWACWQCFSFTEISALLLSTENSYHKASPLPSS